MSWLTDPFSVEFVQRAAVGGALVAVLCGVVGTWVVIRGMAFLGEALAHGMLPGVAVATVLGLPVLLGAATSAALMTVGIGMLRRRARLSYDTSIGMLFVAMLALGVIIVSHSGSFATDATAILFGGHPRRLHRRPARPGGVRGGRDRRRRRVPSPVRRRRGGYPRRGRAGTAPPGGPHTVLVALVTLTVVASYQAVGSLLVVGLLLAPAVAARPWARRIPPTMVLASGIGAAAVIAGLLVSWHGGTAAGASIALSAIIAAALSWAARAVRDSLRGAAVPASALERTP